MSAKNSVRELVVKENGFVFRGTHYSFDDIDHIRFVRANTNYHMNFVKYGSEESAGMLLIFNSGEKINLIEKPGMFLNSNKSNIKSIIDFYILCTNSTFENRISKYIKDIKDRGYFSYGEFYFYPISKIIRFEDIEFSAETIDFMRGYGYIELRKKNCGMLDRLKRELSMSKTYMIDTLTDTDVFFSLLDRFFGLQWSR